MVYRTHDNPDVEKLKNFSGFAKRLGHDVKLNGKAMTSSLNKLMSDIEDTPQQHVLQGLAIRTMAKAIYTTEATGHFGLAFDHYTHFTSPIRRYPDMMVHRLLQHYLDNGKSVDKNTYEKLCKHSTDMEKRAAEAERASIKYKQVEYMQLLDDSEKAYDGVVTGVTDWGIYVEIEETKCEGMIRMSDLVDDFYQLDEENYRIVGKRTKNVITFGDTIKVRIKATDLEKRTMDLLKVYEDES
jgi:ribonuclease R